MKKINEIIMMMFSLAVIIILLMASISMQAFNINNYEKSQIKHDVSSVMNMPQSEITDATIVALAYTKGATQELVYHSETLDQDIFSSQDKEHMVDVRDLYGLLYNVILAMASIIMTISIYMMFNRRHIEVEELASTFNKTSVYFLVIVAAIVLFAVLNFEAFWTTFHKIFFDNDLWLMDPSKDALIQMMPEPLFANLVFKIVLNFFAFLGIFNLGAWWYRDFKIRKEEVND